MATTAANRTASHCTRAVKLLVSFDISEAANVTFRLKRTVPGRRVRTSVGTTPDAPAGLDSFTVTGRLDGMSLTPGSYELIATPVALEGTGTAQTVRFSITR